MPTDLTELTDKTGTPEEQRARHMARNVRIRAEKAAEKAAREAEE